MGLSYTRGIGERGVADVPPEKNGQAGPWAGAPRDTRHLGAERLQRRREAPGIQASAPAGGPARAAPQRIRLGGVRALALLQGRCGLVNLTTGGVRRLVHRTWRDDWDRVRERPGSLQAHQDAHAA